MSELTRVAESITCGPCSRGYLPMHRGATSSGSTSWMLGRCTIKSESQAALGKVWTVLAYSYFVFESNTLVFIPRGLHIRPDVDVQAYCTRRMGLVVNDCKRKVLCYYVANEKGNRVHTQKKFAQCGHI